MHKLSYMGYINKAIKLKHLHLWWSKYQWSIIGLLVIVTISLGFLGFSRYFSASGEVRTVWDLFYLTLQLFTLESGGVSGPVPLSLEVARLLAPALVVYTAAKALLEIFQDQIQLFRARFAKNHVIICGLGWKGYLLARSFRESGDSVVVIELDKENGNIGQAREVGVIVLTGNASDRECLREARVDRAVYLFSVCGDDGVNAEVAVHSRELVKGLKGRELTCFIHINDTELTGLLREREITTQRADAFRLELFNIHESGARAMLSAFPPFEAGVGENKETPCLLVVGTGITGQSVVVQTARQWKMLRGKREERATVTLVDTDADAISQMLVQRYPALPNSVDLNAQNMEPGSAEFHKGDFLQSLEEECPFTQIYICLNDDELALASALVLRQKLRGQGAPIIIQLMHDQGLAALMRGEGDYGFDDLHTFGLMESTCTHDLLLRGTNEILARANHDDYMRKQSGKGDTRESNSSLVPWSELSDSLKSSNRRAADHIGVKLKKIHCGIKPLEDWDAELYALSADEIDILAEMEHVRWRDEREADDWKYAPGPKDDEKKTHPDLVSWRELNQDEKDKNLENARSLPAFLAQAGFEIYPLA